MSRQKFWASPSICPALLALGLLAIGVAAAQGADAIDVAADFPPELVNWEPHPQNPVFQGSGTDTWDRRIRERGYILREADTWRLWYTGYNPDRIDTHLLGYATSADGLRWERSPQNPLFDKSWVEDMCVVRHGSTYYMFAEGRQDIAHWLTSPDGIRWEDQGKLDIRTVSGEPLSPGPYGTPTVWVEGPKWSLFYERGDRGIWLATSPDGRIWKNVQDDPVIACGPAACDRQAVALNQVIAYQGKYFGVYHANADPNWKGPWTTCMAMSRDLVHWVKYPHNPVISSNDSSGVLVQDGQQWRLYTMHPQVKVWFPRGTF